ncbi:hypothetical protein HPB50_025672 [Hyalomma asiaticum]|uniref:Uncharacterized protein n=1 Tax=Hyalomma asiaticum TaxID=266040 RepID=A0ACB7SCG1_HYAAI|nr:hypothetical protein HPB50_025672 [Hyalomma asiaticum]
MASSALPGPLETRPPQVQCAYGSASAAPPANTNRHSFFVGSALAVASLVLVIAVTVMSVYLGPRQRRTRKPSVEGGSLFCCPKEVEKMARYVNTSLDPCNDFFLYVCSNAVTHGSTEDAVRHSELESAAITGMMPKNVPIRQAGHFLRAYYKTCVETILNRQLFAVAIASAFLRHEADLLRQVDSRNAMVFIMVSALKYDLSSCIATRFEIGGTLQLEIDAICYLHEGFEDYLTATVEAMKENVDLLATNDKALQFATVLCDRFLEVAPSEKTFDPEKKENTLIQQVWNIDDIEAGLNRLGFKLQDVKVIRIVGIEHIRALYQFFSQDGDSNTKAAYLLWHTVVSGLFQFHTKGSEYSPQIFSICANSIFQMEELWNLFQAEILTSHDKDMMATQVFDAIRDALKEQLITGALIEAEEHDKALAFFGNLTLATPLSASNAFTAVPEATEDFAENIFRGRAYDLTVKIERLSRMKVTSVFNYRGVIVFNDRHLLLSPFWYNSIFPAMTKFRFLNMASLGRMIAELLWLLALERVPWDEKTVSNIHNFSACFEDVYTKDWNDYVFFSALGLSTVVKVLNSPDWHTVKPAWSLWRLSHAQFFYTVASYERCLTVSSPNDKLIVNVPLTYVEDFGAAFKCTASSPMMSPRHCRA